VREFLKSQIVYNTILQMFIQVGQVISKFLLTTSNLHMGRRGRDRMVV